MTTPLTTPMVLVMNTKTRQGTRAVWAGEKAYLLGATQVPVVLSAAFGYRDMEEWLNVATGKAEGHIYTRNSNPTVSGKGATLFSGSRRVIGWLVSRAPKGVQAARWRAGWRACFHLSGVS